MSINIFRVMITVALMGASAGASASLGEQMGKLIPEWNPGVNDNSNLPSKYRTPYCCFNTELARIVHDIVKNDPDQHALRALSDSEVKEDKHSGCYGLTVKQLSLINFETEFAKEKLSRYEPSLTISNADAPGLHTSDDGLDVFFGGLDVLDEKVIRG